MYRHSVNKAKAAKSFNRQVGRTHKKNLAAGPMRGGWRL